MDEEFILYDEALDLKKLGFDEPCFGYYENQDGRLIVNYNNNPLTEEQQKKPSLYTIDNRNSTLPQWATSAPTYQQAFRWFRDKHSLYVNITTETNVNEILGINATLVSWMFFPINLGGFETYEEAELACLQKLITKTNATGTNLYR